MPRPSSLRGLGITRYFLSIATSPLFMNQGKDGSMPSLVDHIRQHYLVRCLRRKWYELRKLIPMLRERHELERMVGPFGYWDSLQRFQIEFLKERGLRPHHSLLDFGCGPLQGGLEFIRYLEPGKYTGVDIRLEPVAAAYVQVARAGLVGKNPTLIISQSFGRDELGERRYDFIWASQVLYHLDAGDLRVCFERAAAHMGPDSRFYGNIIHDPNLHPVWSQWEGFPFYPHPLDFVRELGDRCGLDAVPLGPMRNFGYPDVGDLSHFTMLEFRKKRNPALAEAPVRLKFEPHHEPELASVPFPVTAAAFVPRDGPAN